MIIFVQDQLKAHINVVHERKKPHKCSICEYSFATKQGLNRHINAVHEGEKSHKCLKFVITDVQQKVTWKFILMQFIKERNSYSNEINYEKYFHFVPILTIYTKECEIPFLLFFELRSPAICLIFQTGYLLKVRSF